MMEQFSRWIIGTVKVRITGDTSRFLNVAVKSGVVPLNVSREDGALALTIRAKQYFALHKVKQRTGAQVKIAEKCGAPFLWKRMMRRPGLVIGAVLGVMLYGYLSGFYWGVTVEGDAPYSETEILEAAAESGAFFGQKREALDAGVAGHALEQQLPRLSWAVVNTDGCFITLKVRPALEREEYDDDEGAYHIVARRGGLVREIAAQRGTVLIEAGTYVDEGEMLVSAVRTIGDPWGEEPLKNIYSHARAEIYAETIHSFTASCPLTVETEREVLLGERRALSVFGVRIPLSLSGAPDAENTAYRREPLVLLGKELPLWIETLRIAATETVPVTFTEEQARERAGEYVEQLIENYMGETGQVLSKKVTYEIRDGVVYATAECTLYEDIAEEIPMTEAERLEAEAKLLEPPTE